MKYLKPIFESNEENYAKELSAFLEEFDDLFDGEYNFMTYSHTNSVSKPFNFNNFDEVSNQLEDAMTKWFTELFNIEIRGKFSGRIPKLMYNATFYSYKKRLKEYYTNFSNNTDEIESQVNSIIEHFNDINKIDCNIQLDEIRYNDEQMGNYTEFKLLFLCSIEKL